MTPAKPKSPLTLAQAFSGQTAGIAALALVIYFLLQFLGGLQDFATKQLSREDRLIEKGDQTLLEERHQTAKLAGVEERLAALATQMGLLTQAAQNCAFSPRKGMPLAGEALPPVSTRKPAYPLVRE
jgi:hypothetical protein